LKVRGTEVAAPPRTLHAARACARQDLPYRCLTVTRAADAASASAAPVKKAAGAPNSVQITPKTMLAMKLPTPVTAL